MENSNKEIMNVNDLINDIKSSITQKSSSNRDEVRIMTAMLNDESFIVSNYSNSGITQHCPAKEFKNMISNIVSATTNISKAEANNLVEDYECKKSDAETMISISKDFFNTTLQTGRKINLGGTERSNISIALKEHPTVIKEYPVKNIDDKGNVYYTKSQKTIPSHQGLTVSSSCPTWLK